MDSQKNVLKELSDLTRNLDFLSKEIRESNKGNSVVQKAVAKSVEDKGIKSKTASDPEKATDQIQKNQETMFSKLLGSVKKSFEDGNDLFKSASLKTLQSAGKTLLETGSLKEAAKTGIESAKDAAKIEANQKAAQVISTGVSKITEPPDLKQKEKVSKENLTVDGMTNPVAKSEKVKGKENITDTKKGIFSRLKDKLFGKKSEPLDPYQQGLNEKSSVIATSSTLENKTGKSTPLAESIKAEKSSPPAESVKTPNSLSPKITPAKSETPEVKKSLKESLKEELGKTKLGSTFKSISALTKKKEGPNLAESGMKNETTILKDQSKAKSDSPKALEDPKKVTETKVSTSPSPMIESSKENSIKSTMAVSAENKNADKGEDSKISSQDIQDIKGLLSAINTTLNGPLMLKDNKPFRPGSNMLG